MNMIRGIVINGKIEITAPADCRDGDSVAIYLLSGTADDHLTDAEKSELLAALDNFEAMEFQTDAVAEDLSEISRLAGEQEKDSFEAHGDKLKGMFD